MVCPCIHLSLVGIVLVNTFLQQQRIVGGVILYVIHVIKKKLHGFEPASELY
jgi:hypothetical protein